MYAFALKWNKQTTYFLHSANPEVTRLPDPKLNKILDQFLLQPGKIFLEK